MKTETPRTDNAQELFQDEYGSGHYVVESNFARHLERELNEANDKLTAALMLCADNGINVKSITVAAMPNEKS
jgi:uncharacterized protein with GYD domain